jgi:hypothetical protein
MWTTYFAVLLLVIVVGYGIAFTRKGKVASTTLGGRVHEIHTQATPEQAFAAIAAINKPFSIDDRDPSRSILVLSSPVTLFSWGFLYPVFLHAEPGGTRIQIGCHSKFFQMGPVVTNAHGKARDAVQHALALPVARVA